ncbi:MAG: hypothetical protein ABEI78_01475 [Candidatus Nanohaloarchaea archaeon]
MKGQIQAVSAILITLITVGTVSGVYLWGVPKLQKAQSEASINKVNSKISKLYNQIISVSRDGKGAAEIVSLNFEKSNVEIERITIKPDKNYLDMLVRLPKSAPYPSKTWIVLKGRKIQGTSIGTGIYALKGKNRPGVLMAKASGTGLVTYRIEYRNMYTTTPTEPRLDLIDIQVRGGNEATGSTNIRIANQGTEMDTGNQAVTLPSGEKIRRKRTIVTLNLR